MTDKLKITKEQLEELNHFMEYRDNSATLEDFITDSENPNYTLHETFTPEQFALLLCGWYEVEQPFHAGDWVVNTERDEIGKVLSLHGMSKVKSDARPELITPEKHFRHATDEEIAHEQERRKWAAIGRKVDEYRVGDIVFESVNGLIDSIDGINGEDLTLLRQGAVDFDEIEIVCPTEERFDRSDYK